MSELKLNGTVVYMSGLWGGATPVVDARVEIIQHHSVSSHTKSIWTGNTNAAGKFNGRSSEWRRTRRVARGTPLEHDEPDPTDVLLLTADITDNSGSTPTRATLPFAWLGDNVPTPPLVLRWQPPTAVKGRVNGIDCYSYDALFNAAARAFQSNASRVTLEVKAIGPGSGDVLARIASAVERTLETIMTQAKERLNQESAQSSMQSLMHGLVQGKAEKERILSVVMTEMQGKARSAEMKVQAGPTEMKWKAVPIVMKGHAESIKSVLTITQIVVLIVISILVTVFSIGAGTPTIAAIVAAISLLIAVQITFLQQDHAGMLLAILEMLGLRSTAEMLRQSYGSVAELLLAVVILCVLIALACSLSIVTMAREGQDLLRIIFAR